MPWASGLAFNIRLATVLLPGDPAVWDGHVAMIVGSVTAAWTSGRPGA